MSWLYVVEAEPWARTRSNSSAPFTSGTVDPSVADTSGAYEILANIAFAVSLITPPVLGFALIRRHEFRVPAIMLIALLVLLPLTFVLEAFTVFAHPGYTETGGEHRIGAALRRWKLAARRVRTGGPAACVARWRGVSCVVREPFPALRTLRGYERC